MTTIATLSPLSSPEQRKLAQYEETIERGVKLFVDVGLALMAIHEQRLYRAEFESFDAYCKRRWGYAKSYSYRLIESAKVYQSCSQIGDTDPPENEAQARELAKVETPEKQADVWVKAVETAPVGSDGKPRVTAAHVRKVAQQIANQTFGKPPAEEPEDSDESDSPDDPTDISESPTPARSDVHGLTPQAVDEAMARLQKRDKAAPNVPDPPQPAEPNVIGELNHDIDYFVLARVSDQPPHIRMAAADNLEVLAKKVRAI